MESRNSPGQLQADDDLKVVVDVIVPAYRGYDETLRCIESVLENPQETRYELIVVDDASPEPRLSSRLDDLADAGALTLLRNTSNLGFVQSVNLGMSFHPGRDVVLLNSDTVVANDWLDRIRRCAYGAAKVGTVTPFSNNATICSYPVFCADNALPEGVELGALDEIFRRVNHGKSVEIPTAVGFCMYIRRDCLNQVGLFDTENFGKGYGEENDFSMRASQHGWLNLLCADTFVYHAGGVSFMSEKDGRVARALDVLHRLHPGYEDLVRSFVATDPARSLRAAVDREVVAYRAKKKINLGPLGCRHFKINEDSPMIMQSYARDTVCVFSEGTSLADIRTTIDSVARNSVLCSRIFLIGTEADGPDVRGVAISGDLPHVPLDFVVENDPLKALIMSIPADGRGVFVVKPGVSVPFAWDARLARVADDVPGIGTVSPVCATAPGFALFGPALAGNVTVEDMPRIDRLLFSLSSKSYFSAPAFFGGCFHLTQNALRALAHQGDGGSDRNIWARKLADQGYMHVITDSLYVHDVLSVAESQQRAGEAGGAYFPEPTREVVNEAFFGGVDFRNMPGLDVRPVQLHVLHNQGGGIEQWARDYCSADGERINLILRPYSKGKNYGEGLALYSDVLDSKPLRIWKFPLPIYATTASHLEYRQVLNEILDEYCVEAILVSSLIGHSLDVLETGKPTIFIGHDYYPYCPAINLHYHGICNYCDAERLADCAINNQTHHIFPEFTGMARLTVRESFLALLVDGNVSIVAPTPSVRDNLVRLEPRFGKLKFDIIAHGHASDFHPLPRANDATHERLRLLVLGQLSASKGAGLLLGAIDEIVSFADVYLLGCGELSEYFRNMDNVHVISRYEVNELPGLVADIAPDLGLLLSIWPETFSYTLSELMQLGIPVLATNVGGFADRIKQDVTGFLTEPDIASLKAKLHQLNNDRTPILRVRSNLHGLNPKTSGEMVAEYHRLLPLPPAAYARYPLRRNSQERADVSRGLRDQLVLSEQLLLSGMWRDINRLNLMLGLKEDVLRRNEGKKPPSQQELEKKNRQLAERDRQLAERDRQLAERERQLAERDEIIHSRDAQLSEIYASTSWKISAPVRWVGSGVRKLKILMRCLLPIVRDPVRAPSVLLQLFGIWRSSGMVALKQSLLRLPMTGRGNDAWEKYHQEFSLEIKPEILSRIREMASPPLISILMPTYNTPAAVLRDTIQSVLNQLYPNWELCIADDGSTQPHVGKMLKEYGARDSRIKLHLGSENRGVSHASNKALSIASGEFVVLLDHDDILEEQALFRMAECVREDDPDMAYSDEVLISGDDSTVMEYVFRPVFSPELLRSHPYIVHLAGFKTELLKEIGGFDESLTISQDYDLILRASERARRIVHIPEILYRWRAYPNSSGHQKMLQVMAVSKNVLTRHLDRCGEKGWVAEGPSFNFFDTRYPLDNDLRVAIIIPTKNHGELVRQCIESIERTVHGVAFDIVLIDHASDDPASRAYFETLKARLNVLYYEGDFNFSVINNWAVSRLTGQYSHYLLCNNDIEAIESGWLERMLELGQKPSVGIVGAKLYYPDRKTIQHGGVCVGAYGVAEHFGKYMHNMPDGGLEPGYLGNLIANHEVSAVTAACLLIRKEAFDEIGGFDDQLAVGFGDVDLCLRVGAKGYRILFCPHAQLVHHESFTRGKSTEDPHPEDSAYFKKKWGGMLAAGDPYFNPNLSAFSTGWDIKLPMTHDLVLRRRLYKPDPESGRQELLYSNVGAR